MYAPDTLPRAIAIVRTMESNLTWNAAGRPYPTAKTTSSAGMPRKNSMYAVAIAR